MNAVTLLKTPKSENRTMRRLKKFFLRPGGRRFGYYWIKYTDAPGQRQWRIGYYDGFWHLDGDGRYYFDSDFIEISERRIPHSWLFGNFSIVALWIVAVWVMLCTVVAIIKSINFITK
jgi:hypothetical protein